MATEKVDELLKSRSEDQRKEGSSEVVALEATRGNSPSHNISDNLTDLDTLSPSSSSETSSTLSQSNQNRDDVYVPMYPSVQERIDNMIQITIDVGQKLPANH